VDDAPIPGSRVRAATKHGTLTVDALADLQPGMARLMDELSRRYWALYYAAKAGNWPLAAYMVRESEKLLEVAATVRPKYAADLAAFRTDVFEPLERAVASRDVERFETVYRSGIAESDRYHVKYAKGFIRFRLPDRPPDWLDVEPR